MGWEKEMNCKYFSQGKHFIEGFAEESRSKLSRKGIKRKGSYEKSIKKRDENADGKKEEKSFCKKK